MLLGSTATEERERDALSRCGARPRGEERGKSRGTEKELTDFFLFFSLSPRIGISLPPKKTEKEAISRIGCTKRLLAKRGRDFDIKRTDKKRYGKVGRHHCAMYPEKKTDVAATKKNAYFSCHVFLLGRIFLFPFTSSSPFLFHFTGE